jgi:hypothetical protein
MSFTYTTTSTFTITHARYIASKVAADLHLCHRYHGRPSAGIIADYAEEFALFLAKGYVRQYEFGFKSDEKRILCWRYTIDEYGGVTDNSPGSVVSTVDVSGTVYYNYLWHSSSWGTLSEAQQKAFESILPIHRTAGIAPTDGSGYWVSDKTYNSGGCSVSRQTFRPLP